MLRDNLRGHRVAIVVKPLILSNVTTVKTIHGLQRSTSLTAVLHFETTKRLSRLRKGEVSPLTYKISLFFQEAQSIKAS